MANGMASLFVGTSGMKTNQAALNTTAHNLANIDTAGYTRQQIAFSDSQYVKVGSGVTKSPYDSTYGLGVDVNEVRRIRNEFIDRSYRNENGRLGYYSAQQKAVEEIEDEFGEMQGVTFQESMRSLYDSINELSKEPSSTVLRSSLIQSASAFMTRADAVYTGLKNYQQTLNVDVANMIDKVNTLGQQIFDLNKEVARIESAGVESANDYRDQRDKAIDELSQYVEITYYEKANGQVEINATNVPFVTTTGVLKMSSRTDDGSDLVIPTWPAYEKDVYPDEILYKTGSDYDKGELKGLLLARGNIDVNYSDVPVKPDRNDYNLATTEGMDQYKKDMQAYEAKQEYYDRYIDSSAILCAIAGLDKLVNGVVTKINDVFCPKAEMTLNHAITDSEGNELIADRYEYNNVFYEFLYDSAGRKVYGTDNGDGSYNYQTLNKLYSDETHLQTVEPDTFHYSALDEDATDYGMDPDKTVGEEVFGREYTERYATATVDGKVMKINNNNDQRGNRSDYTLGNILMNDTVVQNVAKLAMTTKEGKEDMALGQKLLDVWNGDFASIDPEEYAVGNFTTFYNDFTSQFATSGSVLNNYVAHQETMVNGYDDQRQQTAGVSSDEELEKMIKYQQAYNAASRYVNVISEMLEHLVTSLGNA